VIGLVIEAIRKDCVAANRVSAADHLCADCIEMHFVSPANQGGDARNLAALDIAGHDVVHMAEPRSGQSAGAHIFYLTVK
jgi:hypothetical protein